MKRTGRNVGTSRGSWGGSQQGLGLVDVGKVRARTLHY